MNLLKTLLEWEDTEPIEDKGTPPKWSHDPKEYISDLPKFSDKINHFEKYYATGNPESNVPIHYHTLNSMSVNRRLWQHKLGVKSINEPDKKGLNYADEAKALNKNISERPSIPEDFHVYSGIATISHDLHKDIAENDIVHFPSFISTSISPHVTNTHLPAFDVDKHILRIHIPANSKNGTYISKVSHFPDEHEYLLKSNQLLKFKKTPIKIGEHTYMWDARVMHPDEIINHLSNPEVQSWMAMKDILK